MIDVTDWRLNFRGYPVAVVSDGVARLLAESSHGPDCDLSWVLRNAKDTAEAGETFDWYFESDIDGTPVSIERFGEPSQWSVFLAAER